MDYDAATDFSLTDNPAGTWSYGWRASADSPFITATVVTPTQNPALFVWQGKPHNPSYGAPHVMFNASGWAVWVDSTLHRGRKITLVPGPAGELATVRWTAPAEGVVSVQAAFSGRNSVLTSRAYVIHGNSTLLRETVQGLGSTVACNTNLNISAGDAIDFAVDYGADRTVILGTTEIEARIIYQGTPVTHVIFVPPPGRFTNELALQFAATVKGVQIHYTLDGTMPEISSPRYVAPVLLDRRHLVTARAFHRGIAAGEAVSGLYERVYAHAGDGIPDAWRRHYFGPEFPTRPDAAPWADPDDDGTDNFREFLAGTNPLDPASGVLLGIQAIPRLHWRGVSNLTYRVLRRNLATPGQWQVIGEVQGTNGTATFIDLEARLPESYYALEVVR